MDLSVPSRYKGQTSESTDGGYAMPHRSWFDPHKNKAMDTTGVLTALVFLGAMTAFAAFRSDKAGETISWQAEPRLSARVEIRQMAKLSSEEGTAAPVQPTKERKREREEPKRGQSIP
jgi:hypothetical protein